MTPEHHASRTALFLNIPVLNEIRNIRALIAGMEAVLDDRYRYTLLFTDDGSTDGTVEFVRRLMETDPRVHLLQRKKTRRGCQRGGALFDAMLWGLAHTTHSVFIEMDGDLSHRPAEIPLGVAALERGGTDFVIASKYMPGSQTINRPISRRALSAICNSAVRLLISRDVTDYSNGYRFYTRSVAEMLSRHTFRYTSPIYLSEVLAACLRDGRRISEFPSIYVGRAEGLSKLRLVDLIKASLAILDISFRYHAPGFAGAAINQRKSDAIDAHRSEACVICSAALDAAPAVRLRGARLNACTRCGALHYSPRATAAEQTARHDSREYMEHPYFRKRRGRLRRVHARCANTFRVIGSAVDVGSLRGQRVLDVGCSTGEFLAAARDLFGIHPIGLDVSRDAVAVLRQKQIDAEVATIEAASPDLRDLPVITAIDVIEHVMDPVGFLRHLAARLRPGGVGYVETPNPCSTVYRLGAWLSRLIAGRPAVIFDRLFPSEHQCYLPAAALSEAARQAGLEVVRVFTRRLPSSDVAVSLPFRIVVGATQLADAVNGNRTLLCLLVRKPGYPAPSPGDAK